VRTAVRVLIAVNWLLVAVGSDGFFMVGATHRRACNLEAARDVDPGGDSFGFPNHPLSETIDGRADEYRERLANTERVGQFGRGQLGLSGLCDTLTLMVLFRRLTHQTVNSDS
jgi:hypothetical protein